MFTTIMNRYTHETPAIKLYHLRNSLVGSAAGIIDQDIVNNNDYDAAREFLTNRYEDKRIIIEKHIDSLFNLPKINKESSANLRKLLDVCNKNVEALKNLNLLVEGLGEQMLVNMISSRMDKTTRVSWETRQKAGVLLSYSDTMAFLQEQCRIAEKIETNSKVEITKPKAVGRSNTLLNTNEQKSETKLDLKCPVCNNSHEIWKCENYKKINVSEKYNILKRSGCFFNCLQRGHRTKGCSSTNNCKECGKRHHTSLHSDKGFNQSAEPNDVRVHATTSENTDTPKKETNSSSQTDAHRNGTATSLCVSVGTQNKQMLLSTAVVKVRGLSTAAYPCRVLLDSTSQMHFMTERFANLIAQKKDPVDYVVSGLNGANTRLRRMVRTTIESYVGNFTSELEFLVAPRITGDMPSKSFDISEWRIPPDVQLADPKFNECGRIEMLIGAELLWELIKGDRIQLGSCLPVLTNTEFGWVAGGVITTNAPIIARTFCQTSNEELSELLRSFYKLEVCDENNQTNTTDEYCLEHFQRTHQRNHEGRYFVRHPFNDRKSELGGSRQMATRRFFSLERLDSAPDVKKQYSAFIQEYIELGHMRAIVIDENELDTGYYIPHHYVVRPSSTTTKLRVVFDGSAATSTGVAINDVLIPGPTVPNDLTSILLKLRGFPYVFTVDIPKMFRQVGVLPPDSAYQRIVWRYDRKEPLMVYELLTVTYGLASSPFQVTMALRQAAENYKHEFPQASKVIQKSTYMDDIIAGAHSIQEARALQQEISSLLTKACFGAHKWCANSSEILQQVEEERRGINFNISDDNSNIIKTLGVAWNPFDDRFSFSVTAEASEAKTKRKIVSEVAKIYDLLGLVGPIITAAKLILREVSMLPLEWDDNFALSR
ncbi:uncharacterized protein LOC129720908 [Wyeomyia smithii]|uniref:uncharacterized protein LOC129720908 n=1 Tax=Wyeomyia smithii TaxID=174621 RepID=UPI002467C746|nr:uncharacterized protein LOC129720908 [Wyeomyia smithii]